MARIGIVSIYDTGNVGNRLQNFALATVIRELGHDPVVIRNIAYPYACDPALATEFGVPVLSATAHLPRPRWVPNVLRGVPRALLRGVQERDARGVRRAVAVSLRRRALSQESRAELDLDDRIIAAPGDADGLADDYDVFIAGSDQVWNPGFRYGCPTDFLRFARPEQRVSYAASIGVSQLSAEMRAVFAVFLADFPRLSVREEAAAMLIDDVIGRRPAVTLDPTLLLTADHWSAMADRAPVLEDGPFMSSYLLYRDGNGVFANIAERSAAAGLTHHDIIAPRRLTADHLGLAAFLRGIRDAEYVVTDSFHATVFSLLFGTPVSVLGRGTHQDARVRTLLNHIGMDPDSVISPVGAAPLEPQRLVSGEHLAGLVHDSRRWLEDAISESMAANGGRG